MSTKEKIHSLKILFIKLGSNGKFEKDCIEKEQTLRLDYHTVPHELCITHKWDEVHKYFCEEENAPVFVATNHTNQVKRFYEEDENTLWITFYANKLWWCFSKPVITYLPDGTKTRPVIGKWSASDLNGNILLQSNIRGTLTKTQGYRGTICNVSEIDYTIALINNEQSQDIKNLEKSLHVLKENIVVLIQKLSWQDFETLIDLIFRQAGWQRLGDKGKTQKTLDLELLAPVTGEKAIVQIKSQSDINEFKKYCDEFINMKDDYDKFFYVVHSANSNLIEFSNDTEVNLYNANKIAELTISSGLIDWLIKKSK